MPRPTTAAWSPLPECWSIEHGTTALILPLAFVATIIVFARFRMPRSRIVFAMAPNDRLPDLYTMATDGSDVQRVTRTRQWDSRPDWGPQPAS